MTLSTLLLEGLQVFDDRGDLLVLQAPLVGRHHRLESRHDLRLRIQDRLPDVVLFDDRLSPARERLRMPPDPLERRPDPGNAVDGVALLAAALVVEPLAALPEFV